MNTLKREYFHVPLYAWLAGVGALVVAMFYFLHTKSSSTGTSAPSPSQAPYPTSNVGTQVPPIIPINITLQPPTNPNPAPSLIPPPSGPLTMPAPVQRGWGGPFGAKGSAYQPYPLSNVTAPPGTRLLSPVGGFQGATFTPSRTPISTSNLPGNAYPAPQS
jgi:hypothetical protein